MRTAVARRTSDWEVHAVVGLAKGAAGTPVGAMGVVGLAEFGRRAGCVDMTETGGNSVCHNCYH